MSFFDPVTIVPLIFTLTLAGALIGFLTGVFGIGGGAISVPVFYQVFQQLGYSQDVSMPRINAAKLLSGGSGQNGSTIVLPWLVETPFSSLWASDVYSGRATH